MSPATDLVIGLIEISCTDHKIAFLIAFKTGARRDVEDSIGAVAIVGVVAASLNFEVINILGVNLRSQIGGDVGVGDGDAVDQPLDLVASPNMQHVVTHIGSGHIVCDHLHAVGAVRSGRFPDVFTVQHRRRRHTVQRRLDWNSRDADGFLRACESQLKMQHGTRVGLNNHALLHCLKALGRDRDRVIADGYGIEVKFSPIVGVVGLCPVRVFSLQRKVCALNGAVLRIMDDAVNGTENRGQGRGNQEENNSCQASNSSHRRSPFSASGSGGPAWRSVVISALAYCDNAPARSALCVKPKKLVSGR